MRILHVVHQYVPDHTAGTELYTQSVVRNQVISGHEPAVFTPVNRAGDFPVEPTVEQGVRVYRAPAGPRGPSAVFRGVYHHPILAAAFAAVLSRERPDIVHIQHLMGIPAAVGGQLRDAAIPYVLSLHDYWFGCANGQLLTNDTAMICPGPDSRFHNCGRCAVARAGPAGVAGLLGPLAAPLMRRRNELLRPVYDGAARVMAPNEFVRRVYAGMSFSTARVVVNPLGLDAPPDLAARTGRRRAARSAGGLRLGYIGSIARQKGVHTLIAAVNDMPHKCITLEVYGDLGVFPDYTAELRAQARHPGIHFNGLISRGRLWDALADLDVLVMPTLWYEASPAIIREAFAAGVPVVGSDIGATAAMIRDGVDGVLFPPGDNTALSEILLALLRRPEWVAELRAGIAPMSTMAQHIDRIERVYAEALADGSPTAGP